MANVTQIQADVYCTECHYLANDQHARNSDRIRIMSNGIVTCKNCHSGLGGVEPDGTIEWHDEGVWVDE